MKRFVLIILFISPAALAQFNAPSEIWSVSHMQKADMLYEQNLFEEAIIYYKKELKKINFNDEARVKLARCYGKLADYKNERNYYLILAQTNELNDAEDIFNYAEALLSIGDYEEALTWYNNYLKISPGNKTVIERIKGIENIESFFEDSTYIAITPFRENSEYTDFGAVPFNDGVLFTSAREKDLIIRHDNLREIQSLLDIYYIPLQNVDETAEVERIKIPDHWVSNDGPIAVGKTFLVLTRNNGKKKDEVYNPLGIQFLQSNGKSFNPLYEFPFNDNSYSIMHPALSSNEDTLYFASDMPGGFGGLDIFYSVYDGEKWLAPVNVGTPVNTYANDAFPFVEKGVLYFSSNGHEGLGGLDIYSWDIDFGSSQEIKNMGYPINTGWDDFSIYINRNKGYISSNRPGGLGHDDIYEFELLEKPEDEIIVKSTLKLSVTDLLNDDKIDSAEITVINKKDGSEYHFLSSQEGDINELIDPSFYTLQISKSGFETYETELDLLNVSLRVEEVYMKPIFSVDNISLDSILFEYNDFRLSKGAEKELDQIIEIMSKYEQINLEVAAYTDSRGEKEYNHWLSEMRAASTANYLIEQGIPFERVSITGYGETKLLNNCEDGVPCSEEEHMVNRRIEFLFTTQKENKD